MKMYNCDQDKLTNHKMVVHQVAIYSTLVHKTYYKKQGQKLSIRT